MLARMGPGTICLRLVAVLHVRRFRPGGAAGDLLGGGAEEAVDDGEVGAEDSTEGFKCG
jgi:hypothetical protein